MVHRADVLKDRTWSLDGRTFRWTDKAHPSICTVAAGDPRRQDSAGRLQSCLGC